jgi:hypothetical protein
VFAIHYLISEAEQTLPIIFGPDSMAAKTVFVSLAAFTLIQPLLMLKATLRLELNFWEKGSGKKSWIPVMYISRATHLERSSDRIEVKTSMRIKLLVRRVCRSGFPVSAYLVLSGTSGLVFSLIFLSCS